MEDLLALDGEQARQDTLGQAGAEDDLRVVRARSHVSVVDEHRARASSWPSGPTTSYSSSILPNRAGAASKGLKTEGGLGLGCRGTEVAFADGRRHDQEPFVHALSINSRLLLVEDETAEFGVETTGQPDETRARRRAVWPGAVRR